MDPGPEMEFGSLREDQQEIGLIGDPLPEVRRVHVELPDGRSLTGVRWGAGEPQVVLLHGGFESARSWDLLALALARPVLALDLPGCGRSDWISQGTYWSPSTATDVAAALDQLVRAPVSVVGLSFGGIVGISLAAQRPDLIHQLVLVDVLPGCARPHADRVVRWLRTFPPFETVDAIVERRMRWWPNRSRAFVQRRVLDEHVGSRERMRPRADHRVDRWTPIPGFHELWPALGQCSAPVVFIRAQCSRVVPDSELRVLATVRPDATALVVPGARHHIPMDDPRALAALL